MKVLAMKTLAELTEREILALAISSEEEDSRIYMTFAEDLAERYPTSAKMFEEMALNRDVRSWRWEALSVKGQQVGPVNVPRLNHDPPHLDLSGLREGAITDLRMQ
jgi:hypothetical protein